MAEKTKFFKIILVYHLFFLFDDDGIKNTH